MVQGFSWNCVQGLNVPNDKQNLLKLKKNILVMHIIVIKIIIVRKIIVMIIVMIFLTIMTLLHP